MSLRELIGGDKIITKSRLTDELHKFYLSIKPYLSALNLNISTTNVQNGDILVARNGQWINEQQNNIDYTTILQENLTGVTTSKVQTFTSMTALNAYLNNWKRYDIINISLEGGNVYTDDGESVAGYYFDEVVLDSKLFWKYIDDLYNWDGVQGNVDNLRTAVYDKQYNVTSPFVNPISYIYFNKSAEGTNKLEIVWDKDITQMSGVNFVLTIKGGKRA